jgi:hypothetical protein
MPCCSEDDPGAWLNLPVDVVELVCVDYIDGLFGRELPRKVDQRLAKANVSLLLLLRLLVLRRRVVEEHLLVRVLLALAVLEIEDVEFGDPGGDGHRRGQKTENDECFAVLRSLLRLRCAIVRGAGWGSLK